MGGAADDARTIGGGSRWGIKGSSEVSEGLTAVYKFETRLDEDAAQTGNQIYAGLAGGFGSLTVGKFNNAAYLSGGIRDIGNAFGDSDVSSKVGNTVSYGYSTEAFTLQADAIMDEGTNTGKAVDQVQFGLAVNLGDIGTVAIGYEKVEDTMTTGMDVTVKGDATLDSSTGNVPMVTFAEKDGKIVATAKGIWRNGKNQIVKNADIVFDTSEYAIVYHKTANLNISPTTARSEENTLTMAEDGKLYASECSSTQTDCTKATVYRVTKSYPATDGNNPTEDDAEGVYHATAAGVDVAASVIAAAVTAKTSTAPHLPGMEEVDAHGYKASHISATFGLGAVTVRLGHTSKDSNNPMMSAKAKTNFLGFTGSIGDTGMDWRAFGRNKEDHAGKETSPWGIGVGKALGGGAYTYIEHQNDDDGNSGRTQIGLNVDF